MITLQESLRAPFYAPFYATLSRGAFAAEGVEVKFVSSPEPGRALEALVNRTADIGWGGPMRVNEGYQHIPGASFKCFAEVVTKDPFFLVTREKMPPFNPADLMGMRLGSVAEVPTPWLCLQHDVRLAGFDPAQINRVGNQTMAQNAAALRAGELDVAQMFQPFVEELVEDGFHIWYAAADRGLCSYTTFYAVDSVMQAKQDEFTKMVRALYRTLQWVHSVDAATLAEAAAPYFPNIPMPRLVAITARYKALGIWGETPILPRAGYQRLLESMVSGGFVNPGTPYEVAVDNRLAEAVIAG